MQISHQLENKFGKEFAQQARSNLSGTVNPKASPHCSFGVLAGYELKEAKESQTALEWHCLKYLTGYG